jgi:hypothetical protein
MAKRGGLRQGAGRKPKESTELRRTFAAEILPDEEEQAQYRSLLASNNEKIRLDVLKILTEYKHGKPTQPVDVDGELTLVIDI